MHTAVLITCSVVAALVCIANCETSPPPDRFSDDPVLSVVIDGKKFEIPRYKPKEVRLTDKRYEFEQDAVRTIGEKMTKLAKKAIINGRGSVFLILPAERVLSKMEDTEALNGHLMRTDTLYPLSSGFGALNSQMLYRMIKRAPGEKLETLTKEEAYERFELVLEAVEKLTAMSNTGLNLDWTKLTIDGVGVEQYLKPSTLRLARRRVMYNILKITSRFIKNAGEKVELETPKYDDDSEDLFDMA